MARSDELRLPEPIASWEEGIPFTGCLLARVNPGFRAYIDKKYHKIISVVDLMASCGAVGAESVVAACEAFASGHARQWLKVAGDAKADLVDYRLQARPSPDLSVVAEFGSFVGYSCTRMSWRCNGETRIISLESDAVHVFVARHVVALALCSGGVEMMPGMAHDSVRRLADEWGAQAISFAFMDHRGTRFHVELMHLESLRTLLPNIRFLADNTLKPGAPVNLWHFQHSDRHRSSQNWSLPEFLAEECEDWMSASDCLP